MAFVGAGASAAYGRMTWKNVLALRAQEVLDEAAKFILKANEAGQRDGADHDDIDDINRLRRVLEEMEAAKGEINSEAYTVVFQLYEQLSASLRRGEDKQPACDRVNPNTASREAREEMYKAIDDRAKALKILDEALQADPAKARSINAEEAARILDGGLADFGTWTSTGRTEPLVAILRAKAAAGQCIHPLDRGFVGAGIRLGIPMPPAPADQERPYDPPRPLLGRDPLRILRDRLEISRYLTTNYDKEIERLLKAGGRGGVAGRQVLVFGPDKAPELIAFAAENRRRSVSLVYLHGRVDEEIVATERDYQERYCRNGAQREQIDTAIGLAFGANPLLFVGSSMSEDDILRPLRQFMSQPQRVGDRVAVALLPGADDRRKQIEQKSFLLVRYGIYAIHFREATARGRTGDWLPLVHSIGRTLATAFEKAGKAAHRVEIEDALSTAREGLAGTLRDAGVKPPEGDGRGRDMFVTMPHPQDFPSAKDADPGVRLVTPEALETIPWTQPGMDLDLEVQALNACLDWIFSPETRAEPDFEQLRREAGAYALALDSASTAIITAMSCASLMRAEEGWRTWKTDWFAPLRPRQAKNRPIEAPAFDCFSPDAELVYRHPIDMKPWVQDQERKGRFYAGAPSQTLDELCRGLRLREAEPFREARGRRLLLLAARRGLGKGHFFNALENAASPPERPGGPPERGRLLDLLTVLGESWPRPRWVGCAFLNLSFAHEVMSAFDRVTEFLIQRLKSLYEDTGAGQSEKIDQDDASLTNDRVERLSYALKMWAQVGKHDPTGQHRVLIALNSAGLLFDSKGAPKNGQVKHLFDLIFAKRFASAPIDFILVCQDGSVPEYFRRNVDDAGDPILALVNRSDEGKDAVRARRKLERLKVLPALSEADSAAVRTDGPRPATAVHVLKPARATLYVSAYFPRVGILLCRKLLSMAVSHETTALRRVLHDCREDEIGAGFYPNIFEDHSAPFRDAMRKVLNDFSRRGAPSDSKVVVPLATVVISLLLEGGLIRGGPVGATTLEEVFKEVVVACWDSLEAARLKKPDALERAPFVFAAEFVMNHLKGASPALAARLSNGGLEAALTDLFRIYDDAWRKYYDAFGGGRHLLTLVLSGAYETTTELSAEFDDREVDEKLRLELVDDATEHSFHVLEETRIALLGSGDASPGQVILDRMRELLRERASQGRPLPMRVEIDEPAGGGAAPTEDSTRKDSRRRYLRHSLEFNTLLDTLIWHLALIGEPVMVDVLAWCPEVQRACEALKTKPDGKPISHLERMKIVEEALLVGVNRCLIFPLRPTGSPEAKPWERHDEKTVGQRYAVHRQVQRHRLREFGALDSEFGEVDQFTLTIYASQPAQASMMSWDKHTMLVGTMRALSGYPSRRGRPLAFSRIGTDLGVGAKDFQQRLLRAAFGIARSVYSLPILTRLRRPDPSGEADLGCIEAHRRLLWWLVTSAKRQGLAPFYAEEVVWLNNEVAVLSLVQGRLNDAQALFESALLAAKQVESDESGALHVRITLNRALAAIERGKSDNVRGELARIAAMTDEHVVPPLLAKGYLGLVHHLAGESAEAERLYSAAIDGLRQHGRHRAVSIFSRHLMDLLHQHSATDDLTIKKLQSEAYNLADSGGHEDLRYLTILSIVKHGIDGADAAAGVRLHAQLQEVENYALGSGMPRLLCEVSFLRARLLKVQGDRVSATRHAANALEIACVNDLRLRKTSSLLLLAGLFPPGKALIEQGKQMARDAKAQLSLSYASRFGV